MEEGRKKKEDLTKEKNVIQKIRLIANMIAPDNLDKKFQELRLLMFGDLKYPGELGEGESEHPKLETNLNEENLRTVV